MSDQLNWMNQHLILLKYKTVGELVSQGGYELAPKYGPLCKPEMSVEDFMTALVRKNAIRDAASVLAYAIHRRAGVWWGVCCFRKLYAELAEAEKKQAEQAKIDAQKKEEEAAAAAEEAKAKAKEEDAQAAEAAAQEKKIAEMQEAAAKKIAEAKSKFTPEQKKVYDEVVAKLDAECVKLTGLPVMAFINDMAKKEAESEAAKQALKQKPEKKDAPPPPAPPAENADTSDDPMPPEMLAQLKRKAFEITCKWVVDPSAENSVMADSIANQIEDEPEGMLARTAFWSYGNLSVAEKDGSNVPVPAGLAANGLRTALLMAMLTEGGLYSLPERAVQYLSLGIEIACGRNNWTAPEPEKNAPSGTAETKEEVYRKWK